MSANFVEVAILEPQEGQSITNKDFQADLQWMTDEVLSGKGALHFSFQQVDPNDSKQLLMIGCWETKADHEDLDIRGATPKIMKALLTRLKPVEVYFMYLDVSKVDLDGVEGFKAYHVKDGRKASFQKIADSREKVVGAWSVTIPVPPLPKVMPTDPVELGIIEQQRVMAEESLKGPNPDVWIALMSAGTKYLVEEFNRAVSQEII